jgi:hypothetical protein
MNVRTRYYTWLLSQLKTFFADGIRRLVNRYTICVENRGDYVDKWYTLHLSEIVVSEVINKLTLLFDCLVQLVIELHTVFAFVIQSFDSQPQPDSVQSTSLLRSCWLWRSVDWPVGVQTHSVVLSKSAMLMLTANDLNVPSALLWIIHTIMHITLPTNPTLQSSL